MRGSSGSKKKRAGKAGFEAGLFEKRRSNARRRAARDLRSCMGRVPGKRVGRQANGEYAVRTAFGAWEGRVRFLMVRKVWEIVWKRTRSVNEISGM